MNTTHMNLFHSYNQNGSIPIENNISRGLAILLRENRSFLMIFLNFLKEKLNEKYKKEQNIESDLNQKDIQIDFPYDSYEVGFQTSAEEFDIVKKIIGVTLTSEDLPEFDGNANQEGEDGKRITDIAVAYDDTLIVIEVKRNSADCNQQIRQQIAKYQSTHFDKSEQVPFVVLNMIWPDIVQLLGRDIRLNHEKDLLTNDYRDFLLSNFPAWARSESLSILDASQKEQINARLTTLQNIFINYHNKHETNEVKHFGIEKGAIKISSKYSFVELVRLDCETISKNGNNHSLVRIRLWPGDTSQQFWALAGKINSGFVNPRQRMIEVESHEAELYVLPYIKLSYFLSKGHLYLYQKKTEENQIKDWLTMAKAITGQIKHADWDDKLIAVIKQNSQFFDQQSLESFYYDFNMIFKKPNRAFANISCGFEVVLSFRFEDIKEMDLSSNSESNDVFSALIDKSILSITDGFVNP